MSAPSLRCPGCGYQRTLLFDHIAKKVTLVCPNCKQAVAA